MTTLQSVLGPMDNPIKGLGSVFGIDDAIAQKVSDSLLDDLFPAFVKQLQEEKKEFIFKPDFIRKLADRVDEQAPELSIGARATLLGLILESLWATVGVALDTAKQVQSSISFIQDIVEACKAREKSTTNPSDN
jgi:hypothetical protein